MGFVKRQQCCCYCYYLHEWSPCWRQKAQQLSSARSLTQNPGAPMKQGCANLAQMDVVTIEPNRSNLTSSPHTCCVRVHEMYVCMRW